MTIPRDELRRQYETAVEEYRINVRLSWDRTKFYLVLNGAVLAAATGLHGLNLAWPGAVLLVALFGFGSFLAGLGIASMTRGHRYYRSSTVKKTELEAALGYLEAMPGRRAPHGTLGLTTTEGMQEIDAMLSDPHSWIGRPNRRGTITFALLVAFWGLAAIHLVGLLLTFWTTP